MTKLAGLLGSPAPAMASLFPTDLRGFLLATGPRSLASPGSSSRALYLPFRVCDRSTPARFPCEFRAPSLGFSSQSRHQSRGFIFLASFPRSPKFRPQRSSRSRRLAPLWTLRACFIPQPRPGFTLQGFSLLRAFLQPPWRRLSRLLRS